MSELERLINEFCADGVIFKTLGEIAEIGTGSSNTNEELEVGDYPFFVRSQEVRRKNTFEYDETAIITSGDGVGVGKIFHYIEGKYALHQRAYRIHIIDKMVNPKFYFYYMKNTFFRYIQKNAVNSSVTSIRRKMLDDFPVPIPPLPVQEEIVRISDNFTELTAKIIEEITAELKARKQQYEYYREYLIKNSNYKIEKLESIADIYLGLTYTPTYVESGVTFISAQNTSGDYLNLNNVKYISEEEYNKSTENAKPKRGDILFTRVGSNLGHPVIVDTDERLCIFVSLGYLRMKNDRVKNTYIKHWMNTDLFWKQVRENVHGAAKVNLNTGWLKKFEVLIPSLEEQTHIVTVLDKFENLYNDITQVLNAEIEIRKKQYEYYSDKLLTFKEIGK